MAITFTVAPVARATAPLPPIQGLEGEMRARRAVLDSGVEAWGSSDPGCRPNGGHGFLAAVHTAFDLHYPLVLSPDAIWLCIAQGFAAHVKANAERLRGKFVRHAGQAEIRIRRDDFVKGSPQNPWPELFQEFSDQIAGHIGRQRDLVICDFSTTGPCERASSEIVLMDAMRPYFKYVVQTMCGIPEITLLGTVDDWRSIRRRVQALGEYELSPWVAALAPVVDQFIAAAQGQVDVAFWRSLYKREGGSGGPYINGWVNVLFPYLTSAMNGELRWNRWVQRWAEGLEGSHGGGPTLGDMPTGISIAPFVWEYLGKPYSMELLGGFMGTSQDQDTLAIKPAIGWAVRDAVTPPEQPATDEERWKALMAPKRWVFCAESTKVSLIAGRMGLGDSLAGHELHAIHEKLDRIAAEVGLDLRCFVLEKTALYPEIPYPTQALILVGIEVRSAAIVSVSREPLQDLAEGQRALRALSAAQWEEIAAVIPGGLAAEDTLLLIGGRDREGVSVRGRLVFGEPSDVTIGDHVFAIASWGHAVRGLPVAEIVTADRPHMTLDASAAAGADHRARAAEIGVGGSGAYYLVNRPA